MTIPESIGLLQHLKCSVHVRELTCVLLFSYIFSCYIILKVDLFLLLQQSKCQNKVRTVHIWNSGYDVQLETTASIVSLAQASTEVIKDHALKDELVKRKTNCKRKREGTILEDKKWTIWVFVLTYFVA